MNQWLNGNVQDKMKQVLLLLMGSQSVNETVVRVGL